jgi:poly-gamma-glutamate synthesis protein (capsule biosynthesis protein)
VAAYDPDRIEEEVCAARKQADVVIVSLHWGIEYARQPQESQRRIAHSLIDAGAALVIGHHPHTPQPVERHRHGLIAYSLGNFVFDAAGEGGRHGLILKCVLTREGVTDYTTTPVVISLCQPAVAGMK